MPPLSATAPAAADRLARRVRLGVLRNRAEVQDVEAWAAAGRPAAESRSPCEQFGLSEFWLTTRGPPCGFVALSPSMPATMSRLLPAIVPLRNRPERASCTSSPHPPHRRPPSDRRHAEHGNQAAGDRA